MSMRVKMFQIIVPQINLKSSWNKHQFINYLTVYKSLTYYP
jgi:hypothetical protein